MKHFLTLAIVAFSCTLFGQMSTAQWEEEAKTNIRLLPKYGYAQKTEGQLAADQKFIETTLAMKEFANDRRKASEEFIRLGFDYLYKQDYKTAMYRFNQAFLLDSTNSDIYWGFGGVYLTLGNFVKAKEQYLQGIAIDPKNAHLFTDYGTCFMAEYYALEPIDKKNADQSLDRALENLEKSYQIDPADANTTYKLSICHWLKGDCENAWKYYKICKASGGQPITESYTKDLKRKCKEPK